MDIRKADSSDLDALEALYPAAFPDEDLLPLIRNLAQEVGVLSLVAIVESAIAGHAAFTVCAVDESPVALLGPLAVSPEHQRQGIGTALMREGFDRLADAGVSHVVVLGDPAYYGRLGFAAESSIQPPFELPAEWEGAWQSLALDASGTRPAGTLAVPPAWNEPALWGP